MVGATNISVDIKLKKFRLLIARETKVERSISLFDRIGRGWMSDFGQRSIIGL
jgi:hypothetical protein